MANRIPQIIIDMSGDNNFQYVRAIQGDSESEIAEVLFVSEGEQWSIPNNVRVTLRGTKPDGNPILNGCEVTNVGTVIIKSTEQLTAVLGRRKYEICLYNTEENNQGSMTSFPFYIVVVESAMDVGKVTSSQEFTALQNVFASVNSKVIAVDDAVNKVSVALEQANEAEQSVSVLKTELETLKDELSSFDVDEIENRVNTSISNIEERANNAIQSAENATTDFNDAIERNNVAIERANSAAKACEDIVVGTGFISSSEKGANSGVATLDDTGIIPDVQMNKSTIVNQITKDNIIAGLGYTPENANVSKIKTAVTILSSGWGDSAPYSQTVTIEGLMPDSKYDIFVKPIFDESDTSDIVKNKIKSFGFITEESVVENGLLFVCHNKKPSIDFSVLVKEV